MKKYFICPVISFTTPDNNTGYGAKIRELILSNSIIANYVAEIPTDSQTGIPKYSWCLICASSLDFSSLLAIPEVIALPDKSDLNEQFNLNASIRQDLLDKGINLSNDPVTMRNTLNGIGTFLSSKFNINNFSVS